METDICHVRALLCAQRPGNRYCTIVAHKSSTILARKVIMIACAFSCYLVAAYAMLSLLPNTVHLVANWQKQTITRIVDQAWLLRSCWRNTRNVMSQLCTCGRCWLHEQSRASLIKKLWTTDTPCRGNKTYLTAPLRTRKTHKVLRFLFYFLHYFALTQVLNCRKVDNGLWAG